MIISCDNSPPEFLTLLLIEDDYVDREMFSAATLEWSLTYHIHFTIVPATTLREALLTIDSIHQPFDCIVADLTLPDCRELESLTGLLEVVPDTPIVILSGMHMHSLEREAFKLGVEDYILKQSDSYQEIIERVYSAIKRRQNWRRVERRMGDGVKR